MANKDKILSFILTFIIIVVISLVIYFTFVITYIKPSEMGKSYVFSSLKNDLNKKGLLNLDWDKKPYSYTESYNMETKFYSDLDYYNFSSVLYEKFNYNIDTYDCKYFAFIWALYFEKHKIPFRFEYTSNHIFIIAYIENGGFCIANLQSINCYLNKNGN